MATMTDTLARSFDVDAVAQALLTGFRSTHSPLQIVKAQSCIAITAAFTRTSFDVLTELLLAICATIGPLNLTSMQSAARRRREHSLQKIHRHNLFEKITLIHVQDFVPDAHSLVACNLSMSSPHTQTG